ncbi:hypothetical protein, partial [Ferrimicrobium acidiphilum]
FGLFWSEAGIITATVRAGYLLPAILVVLLLLIASIGLVRAGLALTLSDPLPTKLTTLRTRSLHPVVIATSIAAVVGLIGTPTTHIIVQAASSILQKV